MVIIDFFLIVLKLGLKIKKLLLEIQILQDHGNMYLDVLNGYLIFAAKLRINKKLHGEAFNFGPTGRKNLKVVDILKISKSIWPQIKWEIDKKSFFENNLLQLNSNKANKILKWKCLLNSKETIKLTIDWYKNFFLKKDILDLSKKQIKYFENK